MNVLHPKDIFFKAINAFDREFSQFPVLRKYQYQNYVKTDNGNGKLTMRVIMEHNGQRQTAEITCDVIDDVVIIPPKMTVDGKEYFIEPEVLFQIFYPSDDSKHINDSSYVYPNSSTNTLKLSNEKLANKDQSQTFRGAPEWSSEEMDSSTQQVASSVEDPAKEQIMFRDVPINIEYKDGELRKHVNHQSKLDGFHYGRIPNTIAPDDMQVDVYLSNPAQEVSPVWKITQLTDDGTYDEDKYFLGFPDEGTCVEKYINFITPERFGGIAEMNWDTFKKILDIHKDGEIIPTDTGEKTEINKDYIGDCAGYKVFLVNEDQVVQIINQYATAGNHGAYPQIPAGEIWRSKVIDEDFNKTLHDHAGTIFHEIVENMMMNDFGWEYDKAHNKAVELEQKFRTENQDREWRNLVAVINIVEDAVKILKETGII